MNSATIKKVPKENAYSSMFTGEDVTRQVFFPESKEYRINIVNFGKGVRNKLHTHDSEQIIMVLSGKGIVATEKEEKIVVEGDIVFVPAGEKHWHGAAKDSEFSHLYWFKAGSKSTQIEK
jgi:4-carboxymuconolactone decarboxylase